MIPIEYRCPYCRSIHERKDGSILTTEARDAEGRAAKVCDKCLGQQQIVQPNPVKPVLEQKDMWE